MYRYVIYAIFIIIFLLPDGDIRAQGDRRLITDQYFSDTLGIGKTTYEQELEESDQFYDKVKNREYKSKFMRMIANFIVRNRDASDYSLPMPQLEVSRGYFENFTGCTIADINIVQANIFTRDTSQNSSWAERAVDNIHVRTRQWVVEKNLIFHVGDTIHPYALAINEELLRSMPYFATAYFVILPVPGRPDQVTINIFVRDKWSISGDIAWGSTPKVEVFDRNFLGTGDQLSLIFYPEKYYQRPGFEVAYDFNNLLGSFTDVSLRAGVGATNNAAQIKANKSFILPSDHIWGMTAGYVQQNAGQMTFDTTVVVNRLDYGAWYGYSWGLSSRKGTSIYASASFDYAKFNKRPIVRENLNPFYYNTKTALVNVGLSRQNFFQGNMIYGYGRVEDVPYGFKFEITGGYQWNEYLSRRPYLGGQVTWADLTKAGYVEAGLSAGTFFTKDGNMQQSALNLSIRYFSPLFRLGTTYLRQFVNIDGTWGFNRLWGEKEALQYGGMSKIHSMSSSLTAMGYNRLTLNSETVIFTPMFFYHFRFAFFAWGDVGWIGYKKDIFSNQISSAVGIGVRVKNERLIFRNIQVRLGFILRRNDGVHYNPFQVSNEEPLIMRDFTPNGPSIISYE